MKLKDHPLMNGYGQSWPPVWVSLDDTENRTSRNDGVLRGVTKSEIRTDGIVLIMEYDENLYRATVAFPDKAFFDCIYYLMRKSVGLNIQEIGNIDLGDTSEKNLFDEGVRLWSSTGKSRSLRPCP